MAKSKRRVEVTTSAVGVSNNFIDVDFVDDAIVNVHGYIATVMVEPQDADANSNGILAVWVLPGGVIQNTDLPGTLSAYGNEDFAPYLWAMKTWGASNQTPFHWEFHPKTTRNMQRGSRIVLEVTQEGISAGLSRLNTSQTMFTKG